MKDFHIKSLRAGELSAAIVGYTYDEKTKRTRTVYLGSVRADADPEDPARATRLRPGAQLGGKPVVLTSERLDKVRCWLAENGTFYAKALAARAEARAQAEREAQRLALERQAIEASLRTRLEAQWREEFERTLLTQISSTNPLESAICQLECAAAHIQLEAMRLRKAGVRLTNRRSLNQLEERCRTDLDRLQAQANRLRASAFTAFAYACKDAGLMTAQRRPSKAKSVAKLAGQSGPTN